MSPYDVIRPQWVTPANTYTKQTVWNTEVRRQGVTLKPGLYSMRAYARVYARIRAHTPTVGAAVYTSVPGCAQRIRAHTPTVAVKVQTCWTFNMPAQTSAGTPANHGSAPRSPRADALFCIGTYADVYRRIRSPVYTFIHGATCGMHMRRLPAHTRAWSINPALIGRGRTHRLENNARAKLSKP